MFRRTTGGADGVHAGDHEADADQQEEGMPRMRAVSCVVLLSENNEFNGPLMLVPGSHMHYVSCVGRTPRDHYRHSLRKQEYGVPDTTSPGFLFQRGGLHAVKGAAGTVVFFDCNTMHGSNGNISPYPHANLFFVYNSVDNRLGCSARRPRAATGIHCRPRRDGSADQALGVRRRGCQLLHCSFCAGRYYSTY
jgi:ectoine hydroxylase-related dioxygenase (phytanoyl-CoA dioxygenase family)